MLSPAIVSRLARVHPAFLSLSSPLSLSLTWLTCLLLLFAPWVCALRRICTCALSAVEGTPRLVKDAHCESIIFPLYYMYSCGYEYVHCIVRSLPPWLRLHDTSDQPSKRANYREKERRESRFNGKMLCRIDPRRSWRFNGISPSSVPALRAQAVSPFHSALSCCVDSLGKFRFWVCAQRAARQCKVPKVPNPIPPRLGFSSLAATFSDQSSPLL